MDSIRLLLFIGLVAHKVVWEALKVKPGSQTAIRKTPGPVVRVIKLIKMLVLAGLVIQTLFLDVFPILAQPGPLRVLGMALYGVGLATAILGRIHLGGNWANLEDYQVLTRQSLVTHGIYRYIRHPIYTGDLLLLLGLELALNSWLVLAVIALAVFVVRQARAEEGIMAQAFPGYQTYAHQTKGFIPFII